MKTVMWVLWLIATVLLAITPLAVFVAGASDDTTSSDQLRAGLILLLLAWPPLIGAALLARPHADCRFGLRTLVAAIALEAYAGSVFAVAWLAATRALFSGDTVWTLFWAASFAGWVVLARAILRRSDTAA